VAVGVGVAVTVGSDVTVGSGSFLQEARQAHKDEISARLIIFFANPELMFCIVLL
jgi:hypothetical protein